ncbi:MULTISPECIES: hypothetical protein [Pseudomonadaceae]|uniref:hypothetical protein n=1 Tax=Pseudomonadaceae TaxID=135621 RepID=UPI001113521C|nr:hypothetical protein [Pseudomonas otitidis]MCO7556865.1 hypothetical protein [Pseudomonas otitidis]MDG9782704.1 hypothetical protein [Pseudomonas otitidis]QZX83100.1 hypothetical protein K6751_28265 [Pseudomonas otitidis]
MSNVEQPDRSIADMLEEKARRREELVKAIWEADPAVLAEAAEKLREAMRKEDPSQRCRRLGPRLFRK